MRLTLAAVLALGALAASGCGRPTAGSGKAPPSPPPLRAWPEGRAAPMKITDDLTLAVPLAFEREAVERGTPSAPGSPGAAPPGSAHGEVHFDFFLPDFSGYTLDNYRNDADPNKVEVVYLHAGDSHEAEPGAAGEYPPNLLKRAQELLDAQHPRARYGLRCYPGRVFANRITCFGRRGREPGEEIMLTALVPPYAPDAVFQARYYSRRYGGVRIEWRAPMSQLAHWREIDAQIWKFIGAWQVAGPAADVRRAPGDRKVRGCQPKLILASRLARESAFVSASSSGTRPAR